ncbi:MAG: multidrug efflux MFS transporter [Nocardiopsaceae bacterium]|nr:multidrug efflux MFS transporter [Nocardiopsaceae bacterium]
MTPTRTPDARAAFDSELRKLAAVVIAGAIMTILDSTIVNVALTPLGREFHTSLPVIQWTLTGYGLALSMVIPVTGWAVERFGAKTTWVASLTIFIVGSVLAGAASNVVALIVFRVVQGIGGGMVMPVGQMMLARKAGPDRMARVMGLVAIPTMAGPLLGPVVGGLIMDNLSWRWMFYVNVPLCALALVLAIRLLPRDAGHRPARKLDGLGLALLSPGVAFCVYGLSKADADNAQFGIWTAAGVACVAAYVLHARRSAFPLVGLRPFRSRAFGAATVATVVYLTAVYGFMVVLPVYFQVVRGESPLHAGLLMAPMTLGTGLVMALIGRLAHRASARWIIIAGMLVVAAGAVAFTRLTPATGLVLVAVTLFVTSFGHGAILPTGLGAAYQGLPKAEIPSATATFNVVFRVASSIGTAIFATILQQAIKTRIPGTSSLSDAGQLRGARDASLLTSAFGVSFWWVAGVALLAVLPALFLPGRATAPMSALLSPGDESPAEPAET